MFMRYVKVACECGIFRKPNKQKGEMLFSGDFLAAGWHANMQWRKSRPSPDAGEHISDDLHAAGRLPTARPQLH